MKSLSTESDKNFDPKIEVRMVRPGEEGDFLAFMRANVGNGERFEELWKWRQERPEVSGGEKAALAIVDGKIVGCVGVVPAAVMSSGRPINASWQQDSLVVPSMRGKGLGKKLVDEAAKRWDLVMAKGTSQAMYGLRRSMGFMDVSNVDYLVKVQRPRLEKGQWARSALEIGLFLWSIALPSPRLRKPVEVSAIDSFDQSFDGLVKKLGSRPFLTLRKDQKYLHWRYRECPGKRYQIFRAGGREARGAIVLNVTGAKKDEGWVVDLICLPEDKECAHTLIRQALMFFKEQKVSRIYAFATLAEARTYFRRFGFVATGRTPRFTYKVCGKDFEPGQWHFCHGDGDVELYM